MRHCWNATDGSVSERRKIISGEDIAAVDVRRR